MKIQDWIMIGTLVLLMSGCDPKSKHFIANIPEASGIDYCKDTQTLVVVNDEGVYYELDLNGTIISNRYIDKYDFEGVVCDQKNFTVVAENSDILEIDRQTLQITKYKHTNEMFDKKNMKKNKVGIEGIAKINDILHLALQTKNKDDARLIKVKLEDNKVIEIGEFTTNIIDNSGLDYDGKIIYFISDDKNKLYRYDTTNNTYLPSIKLQKFDQEGIVVIASKQLVFLTDDAGGVYRYTFEDLELDD